MNPFERKDAIANVWVEYVGPDPIEYFALSGPDGINVCDQKHVNRMRIENHELIFTDGFVAITSYEYCYAMWYVKRKGEFGGGTLHDKHWKLTDESIEIIEKLNKGDNYR